MNRIQMMNLYLYEELAVYFYSFISLPRVYKLFLRLTVYESSIN